MRLACFICASALAGAFLAAAAHSAEVYTYPPGIGQPFPGGTPTAEAAKITNVSGSVRPFPADGFVIPMANPGMRVDLHAARATHDWDTHWLNSNPCDPPPHYEPVEDGLKVGWPRWATGEGEWVLIPGVPGQEWPFDKGTHVLLEAPYYETIPLGFWVKVYEDDLPKFVADYDLTPGYGRFQDGIKLNVQDLVSLHVWHNRAVTQKPPGSDPPGPDGYNVLGMWHKVSPEGYIDFTWYNTVNANGQSLGTDWNGSAIYDEHHLAKWPVLTGSPHGPLAYGTGLKTEVVATIDFVGDDGWAYEIPHDILDAMKNEGKWIIIQDYKTKVGLNGSILVIVPDWIPDNILDPINPTDGRFFDSDDAMEAHIPEEGVEGDAWLYYADAPGPGGRGKADEVWDTGNVVENWQMFRTGVKLIDNAGYEYLMVDPDDHIWRCYSKMTKITDTTWEVNVPAQAGGTWTIP